MKTVVDKSTGEVFEYTDEQFIAKRNELLMKWQDAKEALDVAKEQEMAFRKICVDFAFDQDKQSGTENIDLGAGYKAKAVKKVNYGFVKTEEGKVNKVAIEKALQKIEKDGAAGLLIAERLVKWTPDLSLTEYKLLSEKHQKIIDEVIVTTDGSPTLEIIAPKAPK